MKARKVVTRPNNPAKDFSVQVHLSMNFPIALSPLIPYTTGSHMEVDGIKDPFSFL